MYPTFTVGETDSKNETTKVAAVTEPKSDQYKLMEVIRHTLTNTELPNPKPEIPDILEQLQQLLRELVPNTLEQTLKSLFDGQRQRQRQPPRLRQQRRGWTDVICFSCGHVIRWAATTAETASAAATTVPRLDRCDLFFMWTVGTYGDALP